MKNLHFMLVAFRVILRFIASAGIWLCQAWDRAWQDVFKILRWMISLLVNRQTWAILTIVVVVGAVIVGPTFLDTLVNFDEWQTAECNFAETSVFINSPRSIAPGDQRYFEITFQNDMEVPLQNVSVRVSSGNGLLLFDEAGTVTFQSIKGHESATKVLPFRVANIRTFEQVPITFSYYFEDESKQAQNQFCPKPFALFNTPWRRVVVQLKTTPETMDTLAKYFGYLGTAITGLLAIKGKFASVIQTIISGIKSSDSKR